MLYWAIQTAVISIIVIFLVHQLLKNFRDTLTTHKVKDLVNAPKQKYEEMIFVMNSNNETKEGNYNFDEEYKHSLLPKQVLGDMKSELKNFLKTQTQTQTQSQSSEEAQEQTIGITQDEYAAKLNTPKIRITEPTLI